MFGARIRLFVLILDKINIIWLIYQNFVPKVSFFYMTIVQK